MSENISRRNALKLFGVAAAAAIGSFAGITSCNKKEPEIKTDNLANQAPETNNPGKDIQANDSEQVNNEAAAKPEKSKRIVFYFTGTGNCMYVAKELSENIISIPQAMKLNQLEYEAEEIGFVYPVYGMMPPNMVRKFIQTAKLKANYFFAIATYGNKAGNAVNIWNDITKAAGYTFDYIATLLMVDNWLPVFDMDEQKKMDKNIPANLAKIKTSLEKREKYIEAVAEEDIERWNKRKEEKTGPFQADGIHALAEEWFTVTDACITCGACMRVCPRKNYTIPGEKAVPKGECELCLACIQNCPHKAIIITAGEKNPKARYRHEAITTRDIINSNNQN